MTLAHPCTTCVLHTFFEPRSLNIGPSIRYVHAYKIYELPFPVNSEQMLFGIEPTIIDDFSSLFV
jgi:hypothetical protein